MHVFLRVSLVCVMVTFWGFGSSEAQDGLTKRNAQGPVTVVVTLMNPQAPGDPVKVKVVLDTHSENLDGLKLEEIVVLRLPDGVGASPVGVEQASGSGHHREAVLIFKSVPGTAGLTIVVKNVGGVAERAFTW